MALIAINDHTERRVPLLNSLLDEVINQPPNPLKDEQT
jgi:hypothetical protein